jgi:predicted secreted Zn-dependent protease
MSVNFVSLGESTNHYTFTAATLRAALQEMTRRGPRDGDGHHAASIAVRADIMRDLQTTVVSGETQHVPEVGWVATATIRSANFRYGFVFRFPRWSNVTSLSRAIQAEWTRYTQRLWVHERGHVTAAMPVLRDFLRRFQALRIGGTGTSAQAAESNAQANLRSQAQEVYNMLAFRTQEASDRYDRATRHGRTQGARLRVGSRSGSRVTR